MRDRNYKRFLFKEAAGASGAAIFANAEVMTPAEFVRDYAPQADEKEEKQELAERVKAVSLYEIILRLQKKSIKRDFQSHHKPCYLQMEISKVGK